MKQNYFLKKFFIIVFVHRFNKNTLLEVFNMKNKFIKPTILICISTIWGCNTTKNIPEGQFLLNTIEIKSDRKDIDVTYLEDFIQQQPNSSLPLFGKIRLGIYNMAGQDTSKWITRQVQKLGQAPIIYNSKLTALSAKQLSRELKNEGYLRAIVDTTLITKGKKINVQYDIHSGEPYRIRNYEYTIYEKNIARSLKPARKYTRIQPGTIFNQVVLEESRDHLTSYLRNTGYYNFSKEYLYYRADTTLNSNQVDLYLSLYESKDSTTFQKFKIRNVTILSGFDVLSNGNQKLFAHPDTTIYKGLTIIHGKNNFLRNSTLSRNTYLRPGALYADRNYTNTTGAFNGIGVIKQTDVSFTPIINEKDSIQQVDAQITLVPGYTHFFQTELQGTNSAGDLGIAPSISYQHQNIFNGAEILKLKLKGSYEFISNSNKNNINSHNFYEIGGEASLSFPLFLFPWLKKSWRELPSSSTQVSAGLTTQHRQEYTRQFFNATLTYRWATWSNRLNHQFDLWDINYIRMPWVSDWFKENYLSSSANAILKSSYQDQLISRTSYAVTYVNTNRWGGVPRNSIAIRANIEVSGLLPRLVTAFGKTKKNSSGQKEILGIAYAEYIKGDISFAETFQLSKIHSLAYRIGLGIANPFGNSDVLPFETRYFSGGANSVRGWPTRGLGPGSYRPTTKGNNFANRVGDIKLDLGIEFRNMVTDVIQLAAFVDAGNIWTIRNYWQTQPGGQFKFDTFYKEIALSYGAGIRFDFGFLLLRLDGGVRAYDPGQINNKWVIFKPRLNYMAWHFAIGYPF